MTTSWPELLAAAADLPELEAHRRRLVESGVSRERADAEARAAVEVGDLLRQRQQRVVELAALNEIAGRLARVPDPADLLVEVVEQARRLLGVDLTYLALLEGDDLRIEVASGARTPHLVGTRLRSWAGLVGTVVGAAEPRWTLDYRTDASLVHEPGADRAAEAESIRGLLGVPLAVQGRILGVLLAAKREERRFARDEVSLLEALAAHAAVALDNARSARELGDAKEELETTLRLDDALTRAVLVGGDPASLVERVQAMSPVAVRWAEHPGDGEVGAALASLGADGRAGLASVAARPLGLGRRLVQPVVADGELLGALVVDPGPDDEVPADARLLAERAAPLIALTLVGARATARAAQLGRDIATIDLLTRAEPDPAADRSRWRGAGLDPRRAHQVVVAEGDPAEVRRFVAGLVPAERIASARHRGQLVLLVPADVDLQGRWTGPSAPAAGLAGPVTELSGVRAAYVEASRTARAFSALGRRGTLGRADELGVFAVLLSRTGRRELREQVRRELGPVLREEELRGVPLLATLETYLDQGRRPTATAGALRVHVNTVYQRTATLDRLLGEGWRDRALELQVLLRLHRAAAELEEG